MARGRIEVDMHMCKGCGYCLTACRFEVVGLSEAGTVNKFGFRYVEVRRPENCTGCGLCGEVCPDSAITVWRESRKAER